MVLTHAYKKVLRVQKELAQVQEGAIAAEKVTNEVLLQKIDEVKSYYEKDLIKALSRQAQALQENYEAAKQAAIEEYERRIKQGKELGEAENLVDLRSKYNQATSALAAMEEALKARQVEDVRSEKFKKLWSYCNTLYSRINFATYIADDGGNDVVSVDKNSLLKEFPDDELVKALLKTIPDEVGSVERLRVRFFDKVDKVCRRVAVFKNDEEITLWKYLLGTLQASLTARCEGESEDKNVFAILDRTALFLKRGDLLEAVCTLNQIEGSVARRICQDWLKDARSVLETNQALFALMTHATANNLH
jgi:DNA/RNA-binding domain of Phe-tRNA-synthetase-like protein